MSRNVSISWALLIWLIIGVVVAINKDYAASLDTGSEIATFILAVLLWPIPATDGLVLIQF